MPGQQHLQLDGPPPLRWTPRLKEELVRGLIRAEITPAEAIARFDLTGEELAAWRTRFARYGRRGLNIQKTQELR